MGKIPDRVLCWGGLDIGLDGSGRHNHDLNKLAGRS